MIVKATEVLSRMNMEEENCHKGLNVLHMGTNFFCGECDPSSPKKQNLLQVILSLFYRTLNERYNFRYVKQLRLLDSSSAG